MQGCVGSKAPPPSMQDVVIQANRGQYTSAVAHFASSPQRLSESQSRIEAFTKINSLVFDHKYLAEGAVLLDSMFDWTDSEIRLSQPTRYS